MALHLTNSRQEQHEGINRVVKPFDWSYSTDYKGTVITDGPSFAPSEMSIPLELLKLPDPILFFDEVVLYEDEMADNGITMLSCKIRVMPDRLLLLSRFFMRLDNVLFRLRDTRVFIEFGTGDVIREYVAKEEKYDTIREVCPYERFLLLHWPDLKIRSFLRVNETYTPRCAIPTASPSFYR